MAKQKRVTAKQACIYLKLDTKLKIPICTIEPIICSNWFCEAKGFSTRKVKCHLLCFRNCAIKNPKSSLVSNLHEIYSKTIVKLDEILEHYKNKIPQNELIGGLLAFREHEVLRAFYATPGAFTDVFGITELIPEDISFLKENDIAISNQCNYFLALLSKRNILYMELKQIINGDLLIYCTPEGLAELGETMQNPENDDFMKLASQRKSPSPEDTEKSECHHVMRLDPLKNRQVIEWCKANTFQREVLKFNHQQNLHKIHHHYHDIMMTGCSDARQCYELSYQPYMNSIYTLRNIYSHSRKSLRIAKKYKDLWTITEKHTQWLPLWDNSLVMFEQRDNNQEYLIDRLDIDDDPEYPMHIGKKTFFPSMIMWTFVGKNWDDICSNRWSKGPIFESKLEHELYDRNVNIIDRNIQLSPDDEVDFLCEKDNRYYMIEAKNYGPNWDYSFLGSLSYGNRMSELNSKIALAPRRLAMIESVRERFGIPSDAKIQGVIATSYAEPHINVPERFIHLTIDTLKKVFGKKEELPRWQKEPVFQIPNHMLNEMHKKLGIS